MRSAGDEEYQRKRETFKEENSEEREEGQGNDRTVTEVSKIAPHEKNEKPPLNAWTTKKHVAARTQKSRTRLTRIKSPKVDRTAWKKTEKWVVNSQAWPKSLKLPSGGNVTDQPPKPKSSKNKALNKWPTSKEESPKIGKI
ncbi:hypothetical protein PIB30_091084 [Stylosanthes scabra]|uniref:Uncharacterized protein n=1 Tax=Stylosanthes scabra TaxID=79078 RepID=A0ABU6RV37_9FABA|nr:hypothetical protein [Stylosanthes scabra]